MVDGDLYAHEWGTMLPMLPESHSPIEAAARQTLLTADRNERMKPGARKRWAQLGPLWPAVLIAAELRLPPSKEAVVEHGPDGAELRVVGETRSATLEEHQRPGEDLVDTVLRMVLEAQGE